MTYLRAKKTTRNKDDVKVLLVGIIITIGMLALESPSYRLWDTFIAKRPFIEATVEVIYVSGLDAPMIKYDADANQEVEGVWIASIRQPNDDVIIKRRGRGNYKVKEDAPKLWSWKAFFEGRSNDIPPIVPKEPFKVCVRYQVRALDSGVLDNTEVTCSEPFLKGHLYK